MEKKWKEKYSMKRAGKQANKKKFFLYFRVESFKRYFITAKKGIHKYILSNENRNILQIKI